MPSSRNSFKTANISHRSVTIPGAEVGHDLYYKYGRFNKLGGVVAMIGSCEVGLRDFLGSTDSEMCQACAPLVISSGAEVWIQVSSWNVEATLKCECEGIYLEISSFCHGILFFFFFLNNGGDCFGRLGGLISAI